MPANCVSNSTRAALHARHHASTIAHLENGATHQVIRVQKNGKRVVVANHAKQSRFTLDAATAWMALYARMNPSVVLELEEVAVPGRAVDPTEAAAEAERQAVVARMNRNQGYSG